MRVSEFERIMALGLSRRAILKTGAGLGAAAAASTMLGGIGSAFAQEPSLRAQILQIPGVGVAVSWMIGKSLMEYRFGPAATLARHLGWDNPAFFSTPWLARTSIILMDAWVSIPFMMILLLAGLQALPAEVKEAAKVDGASSWQSFKEITFPLMLPVSLTVVILRIIFELKLADIVINVTAGGPGGATDTVSSFIFREYRDRSNVGYGTMLAQFYLIIIIVFIALVLKAAGRWMQRLN